MGTRLPTYCETKSSTWLVLVVGLMIVGSLSGCVRRRMTIRTNPPGAMVYVDHQTIGTSPVSTNFTYYGTRQFEIVKDGYRTEKFLRRFNPPWYQWPVIDFFAESVYPYEKRDERIIDVELTNDPVVPTDALIRSGEELRTQATQGRVVGAPPTLGAPTAPISDSQLIPSGNSFPGFGSGPFSGPSLSAPAMPAPTPLAGPGFSIPAASVAPGASFRPPVP